MTELRTTHTADLAVQYLALVVVGWVIGRDRCGGDRQPPARSPCRGKDRQVAARGYSRPRPRCLYRVPNWLICTPLRPQPALP